MRIYADHLGAALRARLSGVRIRDIVPWAPKWAGRNPQAMRFLRYLVYPLQAHSQDRSINHITEASYAHLAGRLDPARTVVTVHDLVPLLSWRGLIPGHGYPHAPRLFERSLSYLRRTAGVITPSETVRRDVIKYGECREEKVHVVHHGIERRFQEFSREERLEQRRRFGLPMEGHLILISGDQAYKNHDTCFRVLQRLRKTLGTAAWLVRVGRSSKGSAISDDETAPDRTVIDLGLLPHAAMPSVYNAVDCLLFPSWYEGFGWPPLEAMACGIPVVASNAGSLPEIVGDAGYLCAPDDVPSLAERLREVLKDIPGRSQLIDRGHQWSSRFTWDRHAERIYELYTGILSDLT